VQLARFSFSIDRLCINQSDLDKRNDQVKLMDKIYQKAKKTIVWLGIEDNSLPDVAKIVETIGKSGPSLIENSDTFFSSKHFGKRDYSSQGLPSFRISEWLSIFTFYSRTWFHRMWILQEIILSQDAIIFCGNHFFLGYYLAMTADFISRSGWASDIIGEGVKCTVIRSYVV
jgi:hypothetical protein